MGELARFYALSDAAFIGGSLVDWGGQNLLEPAYYGKPVFFGPHMENFATLAEAFLERGGARVVRTEDDLAAMFLPGDKNERRKMGAEARRVLDSLAGATEKTLAVIERMMRESERPEQS
jgi:3-deoxy-D-manno-octulosonic-acid transferase